METFTVSFYGGWYVTDNRIRRTFESEPYLETQACDSEIDAEKIAADHNKTGDRLPFAGAPS